MMAFDFQRIAQVATSRGLNTFLEGLALVGVSWIALRYSSARSSMTRFAVWFATLLVVAGLPMLMWSGVPRIGTHSPEVTLSNGWANGIFTVWAVMASLLLIRLAVSLVHISKLRGGCTELDGESHPELIKLAVQFSNRRAKLLVSDNVRVPTALGFFHPAVVIPAWALHDLSADQLRVIVLHELAHLRRWDDWTNLAQQIVKALFFFHPAVWWIDSRLALEREIACDDLVLEQTSSARAYAASLVSVAERVVAEKMRNGRRLALAQSALGRMKEVSQRIARILDGRQRGKREWRPAAAIIGALTVLTFGAMPFAPELVSFRSKSQPMFSAESDGIPPVGVVPASVKWSASDHGAMRAKVADPSGRAGGERPFKLRAVEPTIVPVKATERRVNHKPKVMLTKAAEQTNPAETLLVFRSTQVDESGMPIWSLSVWRTTSPSGRTVQEMIVMNSI